MNFKIRKIILINTLKTLHANVSTSRVQDLLLSKLIDIMGEVSTLKIIYDKIRIFVENNENCNFTINVYNESTLIFTSYKDEINNFDKYYIINFNLSPKHSYINVFEVKDAKFFSNTKLINFD